MWLWPRSSPCVRRAPIANGGDSSRPTCSSRPPYKEVSCRVKSLNPLGLVHSVPCKSGNPFRVVFPLLFFWFSCTLPVIILSLLWGLMSVFLQEKNITTYAHTSFISDPRFRTADLFLRRTKKAQLFRPNHPPPTSISSLGCALRCGEFQDTLRSHGNARGYSNFISVIPWPHPS